ncbi:MAG: hypothetical protein Q8Q62_00420 [Mesorhizobium sp.]|nr:hypothetical protein [Mesorhizobium sp.]
MSGRAIISVGLLLAMLLAIPRAIAADGPQSVSLDAVAAPGVTYADLVRQIVPDLAKAQGSYAGSKVLPMRHAASPDYGGATPERFFLSTIPAVHFETAGTRYVLLLLDLGRSADFAEGLAPMALFDISGTPRLIDALDVAFDAHTGFAETGLSPGRDGLVVTTSTHFNSNQAYVIHAVLALAKGRFELVDTISTFNEQSCAGVSTQRPAFMPEGPDAFSVTVAIETEPGTDDCEDDKLEADRREISVTYRRATPGGTYVAGSDALERLAKENEGRF